jgi:hypothetical protein
MAAKGYPGSYQKGTVIRGLDQVKTAKVRRLPGLTRALNQSGGAGPWVRARVKPGEGGHCTWGKGQIQTCGLITLAPVTMLHVLGPFGEPTTAGGCAPP